MKNFKFVLFILVTFIFCNTVFSQKKVIAIVNGEKIYYMDLMKRLKLKYEDEVINEVKRENGNNVTDEMIIKFLARNLDKKIIKTFLEEMITFTIMEQNLNKIKIDCEREDYVSEAKVYEERIYNIFQAWGFKYPYSFVNILLKILKENNKLLNRYKKSLEDMSYSYRLSTKDKKTLVQVMEDIKEDKYLIRKLRRMVFKKYHLHARILKQRIKLTAKIKKYVEMGISRSEVKKMAEEEKLALTGGRRKISHIMLFTVEKGTKRKFSPEEEKEVLKKIIKIKNMIKSDNSNFYSIASMYSEDTSTNFIGGDLGWIPRWNFIPRKVAEIGYKMPLNKISKPVKSELGFHLVLATEEIKGKTLEYKELMKKARENILFMKKEELMLKWVKAAKIERKEF